MRILHTSDWHLGRHFGAVPLMDDQCAFLDWLVGLCRSERVELVVMAGDVYDRAVPPAEVVPLFNDAVSRLCDVGARVVVITGNHDSVDRVTPPYRLLDASGAHVRGGYGSIGSVLRLTFSDGPLDIVPLPYLDPQGAPDNFGMGDGQPTGECGDGAFERRLRRSHHAVLASAVALARRNVMVRRSLAVAHAYVVGGVGSDSERALSVGGTDAVDASVFDGFSYVALGHLHRPQGIDGRGHMRYAGSPLAYSFSEDHPKTVVLIDMATDGLCRTTEVPIPVGRRVHTVEGTMQELLTRPPADGAAGCFVRAIVTDSEVVLDARPRLGAVYPHVVEIELRPAVAEGMHGSVAIELSKTSAMDAIRAFWLDSTGVEPTEPQRQLLEVAVAAAQREELA